MTHRFAMLTVKNKMRHERIEEKKEKKEHVDEKIYDVGIFHSKNDLSGIE